MESKKIDHICIAVKDLDAARKIWEPILGKSQPDDPYVDEPEKIRVARYWLAGVGFELMESTAPDGPVAKWIEKNGEGVMLISFNVENTREAIGELENSRFMRDTLGDHVFHNFVSAKKREWAEYISQVTNWEVDRYLTSY